MTSNRSMMSSSVIPVLSYPDVPDAVSWLITVFDARERLRIGTHWVQLSLGGGHFVVRDGGTEVADPSTSVTLRVDDVDAVWARALHHGAHALDQPTTWEYGERQATLQDPWGHRWTLSQTIEDVDPEAWGGELVDPG